MQKGQFIISLDAELAWGRLNDPELKIFIPLIQNTKEVIENLMFYFDKYNIPATWAIVGKLIEKEIKSNISDFYPSLSMEQVYTNSILNDSSNSLISAPYILKLIRDAKVQHEIASHSYSHITFKEASQTLAENDIKEAIRVMKEYGLKIKSFVYPRNSIGHKNILIENGINIYRGVDKFWYENFSPSIKKSLYQIDYFLGLTPSTVLPVSEGNELVNIPGSMLFRIPHQGFKKYIPFSTLTSKAIKGLDAAANKKEIFHLWFHPFNFAYKPKEHFKAFEKVLKKANQLREENRIDILTMEQSAKNYLKEER